MSTARGADKRKRSVTGSLGNTSCSHSLIGCPYRARGEMEKRKKMFCHKKKRREMITLHSKQFIRLIKATKNDRTSALFRFPLTIWSDEVIRAFSRSFSQAHRMGTLYGKSVMTHARVSTLPPFLKGSPMYSAAFHYVLILTSTMSTAYHVYAS